MKTICSSLLVVLALASSSEAAILYRGRLTQGDKAETRFDEGASYPMAFRLYRQPQGGEPFCRTELKSVGVGRDGSFEVLLDDPAIDGAFAEDASSVYVGLTLDAGRELMPRRQILMLPRAARARTAGRLARDPKVETLAAQTLKAASAKVESLSAEKLAVRQAVGAFSMQGLSGREADGLDLVRKSLSVFGEVRTLVAGKSAASVGETLVSAPADGVAFVCSTPGGSREPKCPGFVRLCRKGDAIGAPVAGEQLTVRFYSYIGS